MTPLSNLRQLADIISTNVDVINQLSQQHGVNHPTIDDLYEPESASEKFTVNPDVLNAALLAVSAASQLVATLKLPGLVLLDRANGFHVPSALRVTSEGGVVELLREAGPHGMHVKDIGSKTNMNPVMIGRTLRLLATHYFFKEVEPNVFANNRLSSMMDTGKTSGDIVRYAKMQREKLAGNLDGSAGHRNPALTVLNAIYNFMRKDNVCTERGVSNVQGERYIGDGGAVSALVGQCTDEVFKSSAYLAEVVLSDDDTTTPFQRAMQFNGSMWEFFEKHTGYLQRVQMAMVAWNKLQPQQRNFKGFDWSALPSDALIIDVGGGNGSQTFEIAQKAPHIKIVLQDREQTIEAVTKPTWDTDADKKRMIESGKVILEPQDFFAAQPPHLMKKASVFFLRFITHDWSATDNIKILKHLRAAAASHTKLILVDQLVPYACAHPASLARIEGSGVRAGSSAVPAPLLANLGEASSDVYLTDFTMAALLNAQERTLGEFEEITSKAGWGIEQIHQTPGSSFSQIICAVA